MADQFEIIGMGDTEARPDGTAVSFILETRQHGPLKIACASQGLEILIGSLTALLQEAVAKGLPQSEAERRVETIPIEQIGCGAATNSLDVLLSPVLPSGSMLNLALSPELARDLAEQLAALASDQISQRN